MPVVNIKTSKNRQAPPPSTAPDTDRQVYPSLRQFNGGRISNYVFKYPPTNVQFENLSPEYAEVERPGLVPLIGLRQYKLMRLQFEFLVANPFDGIWYPVDGDLLALREIANNPGPIYFNGMDNFLGTGFVLPGNNRDNASGAFFRIVDFSVNSLRRNTDNEITAAQCTMAMQEDYNLAIKAVSMPAITYPAILKPRVPKPKGPTNAICGTANVAQCLRTVSDILGSGGTTTGDIGFPTLGM